MILAVSRTGDPSLSCVSSSGITTFGGSGLAKSSLVGGGAFNSRFENFVGSTYGRVSIDVVGRIFNLHEVSALPDGFVA